MAKRRLTSKGIHPAERPSAPVPEEIDDDLAGLEAVLSDDALEALHALRDEVTPQPFDVEMIEQVAAMDAARMAQEAWDHANRVNRRTVNLLSIIARDAGAGMQVAARVTELDRHHGESMGATEQSLRRDIEAAVRVGKRARTIAIGILIPVAAALIAVGARLYTQGYDSGVAEGRMQLQEQQIKFLELRLDRIERNERRGPRGEP